MPISSYTSLEEDKLPDDDRGVRKHKHPHKGRRDLPIPNYIKFRCYSPDITLVMNPGNGSPYVTGGYGGWDMVARPQRIALTRWHGRDPIQMDIPVMFEGFHRSESVEHLIRTLELLAGVGQDDLAEPPKFRIITEGDLVQHQDDHRWVITNITPDTTLTIVGKHGKRERYFCTISVMQHIEAEHEEDRSAGRRNLINKKRRHHARFYVVKKGDTLQRISRKVYGTPDFWDDIAKLNKIRDPRTVGRRKGHRPGDIGDRLTMPKE